MLPEQPYLTPECLVLVPHRLVLILLGQLIRTAFNRWPLGAISTAHRVQPVTGTCGSSPVIAVVMWRPVGL